MSTKAVAFVSFGMGGPFFDPPSGETALVARLKAIGINTMGSPYRWSDTQTIVNAIMSIPEGVTLIVGGDSLGANEAPAIAQALLGRRTINYLFGFQRSEYGVQVTVPENVIEADSIYDPIWFQTFGLGDDPWTLDPDNKTTRLTNTPIEAQHPDDYGEAQDIVFNKIKQIIGA